MGRWTIKPREKDYLNPTLEIHSTKIHILAEYLEAFLTELDPFAGTHFRRAYNKACREFKRRNGLPEIGEPSWVR